MKRKTVKEPLKNRAAKSGANKAARAGYTGADFAIRVVWYERGYLAGYRAAKRERVK